MTDIDQRILDLENRLREELTALIEKKFDQLQLQKNDANDTDEKYALSIVPQKQMLALVTTISDQVIGRVGQEVYQQVVDEINEKIVPQVNNMVDWVNYSTQDGGEVVDNYRRAAEIQANKIDPNIKLITDGVTDKRIISEHVRTFFGGPDEDSSTD